MDLNLVIPNQLQEITPFYRWESLEIKNDKDLESAGLALSEIAGRLKDLEAFRKKVVGPIKQGISAFEERCRTVSKPLLTIDGLLRSRVEAFMDSKRKALEAKARAEQEEKIRSEKEAQRQAQRIAMETGSNQAATEALQRARNVEKIENKEVSVSQTVRTSAYTMAEQSVWEWEVTNHDDVPREFMVVNEKLLNQIAKKYSETKITIPGIRFELKTRVSIRR